MTHATHRTLLMAGLAAAGWLCNGEIGPASSGGLVATAQAVVGRPATPVSYAGVARRTTVRAATPGAGTPGVGVAPRPGVGYGGVGGPASGVGVLPGAGAGQAGVGYSGGVGVNVGGPVNRAGVR
jgi:hypothetical protein